MQFPKGQSGNPAGRPRGSRNKKTILFQQMLDDHGEAIVEKAIQMALAGNPSLLRTCMDRIVPKRTHEPVPCELPPITKASDAVAAMGEITDSVGAGDLAPAEAAGLAKVVAAYVAAVFTHGLDERLTKVEAAAQRRHEASKVPALPPAKTASDAEPSA
jgi:hypothetical protein